MKALKPVTILIAVLCLEGCDGKPPTDAHMISVFQEKEAVFEQLRSDICRYPHAQTIWIDADPDPTLPLGELAHFRTLLSAIKARRIAAVPRRAGKPCSGAIDAWSSGMLDSGDSKSWSFGYLPGKDRDDLRLAHLDNIDFVHTVNRFPPPSSHGHRDYWRHMDRDWWLEWDHWE